jgi:hypothetical protein
MANALSRASELSLLKEEALALLDGCHIEPSRRAETLTEGDFLRLAEAYSCRRQEGRA